MREFVQKQFSRVMGWLFFLAICFSLGVVALSRSHTPPAPPPPETKAAVADVAVREVARESIEITQHYTGIMHPWERYQLSFEMGGRIAGFNALDEATQFDEGMKVQAGQVVARLDDRLYQAAFHEAQAELDRAQAEKQRADELRQKNPKAMSENEYQTYLTNFSLSEARLERAATNLHNTQIRAPASGVISKRLVNPGVAVAPHVPVLEILEIDNLLLHIQVPESHVHQIRLGQLAHVQLIGHDLLHRPWPRLEGHVYRIAETAEQGMFTVEIKLPNPPTGSPVTLRPGLVAQTDIVVQTLSGFRVPLDAGLKRENEWSLFVVSQATPSSPTALRVPILEWIEQDEWLLLPDLPAAHRQVITRGHHRLQEGTPVRIVPDPSPAHHSTPHISISSTTSPSP